MSLSLSVCAFSSRAGSEKMNFSSSAASTKHQHGKGSANCSAWWKWILQHPLHTMEMPLSMHLLEGERKNHKKTSTEGYSNKAFSHSQMSLHCHAAQLILTYPATGFLWIFKGAEMIQSWGKKTPKKQTTNKNSPRKPHSLLSQTKTTYQGLAAGLNTSLSSMQFTQHTNWVYIFKLFDFFFLF